MAKKIEIFVSDNVPTEMYYYIADCWADFVTCDLGLLPKDLLMVIPL